MDDSIMEMTTLRVSGAAGENEPAVGSGGSDMEGTAGVERHDLRCLAPNHGDGTTEQAPAGYTRYLVLAACTASLGGILFGYDLGIISAALLQLRCDFHLSAVGQEWVVTSMLVGALVASLTGGFLIDGWGRRRVILINSCIFLVGAAVLTAAPSLAVLIVGRLVLGFAISLAAISETVYIAEIAPAEKRGRLVTLNELGIVLGFLLAYGVGYVFVDVRYGWRYMFGLSAIPAILQFFGRLVLPASPRYLIMNGQLAEAKQCLRKLRGYESVDAEVASIAKSISAEKLVKLRDLLRCFGSAGRRLVIGGGLVFLQQMTGQPTILYYAPAIFHSLGFTTRGQATLASLILGIVKFVCACIALKLLDSVGRRRLLLVGVAAMAVCMLLMSTVITSDLSRQQTSLCSNGDSSTSSHNNMTGSGVDVGINASNVTSAGAALTGSRKWFSLLGLVGYIAGYQFGFGPCTWIVLTEIYPSQLRGRAVALATSLNWGTNILISAVFLDLKSAMGLPGLFALYTVVCGLGVVFVFLFIPETKGRSLEDISHALSTGSFKNPRERLKQLQMCLVRPFTQSVTFSRLEDDRDAPD